MRLRFAVAPPGALAACVLLAACGGTGSSPASTAAAKEQFKELQAETEFVHWARCLREHGVNAEVRSGGHGLKVGPGSGGPGAFETAEKTCARLRPKDPGKGNASPQERVEQEERTRNFVKCMREHGVELRVGASGNRARIEIGSGAPNPESPAFQRAQSACGGGPKG